ncbi:hypothetical protein [Chryseobacterium sp. MYb328]|uniref:hypothetical protein n=1 Tax=Chryseobacterium sp. MYb328 TaxID=2745231 RepID=UPI0030A5412A
MRLLYNILFFLFSTLVYSQNSLNQIDLKNLTVDGNIFVFAKKQITCFEKTFGKLNERSNDDEIVPFINTVNGKILENDNVLIYMVNKKGYIKYIDLEKSNMTVYYKKTIKLSSSTTSADFKKVFPKSYKSPSYIPGTSPENAVGYTVVITDGNKKAYANFTFYYNQLVSISVSDRYSKITD